MSDYNPYLSKTLYIKGCQCQKALWLKKYRPELADEISMEQQALFDSGTEVGILSQQLFPGGVLIPYAGHSMAEQVVLTEKSIAQGIQGCPYRDQQSTVFPVPPVRATLPCRLLPTCC